MTLFRKKNKAVDLQDESKKSFEFTENKFLDSKRVLDDLTSNHDELLNLKTDPSNIEALSNYFQKLLLHKSPNMQSLVEEIFNDLASENPDKAEEFFSLFSNLSKHLAKAEKEATLELEHAEETVENLKTQQKLFAKDRPDSLTWKLHLKENEFDRKIKNSTETSKEIEQLINGMRKTR